LSFFGRDRDLKKLLMATKKYLKEAGVSARFINKDFKNLSSAQIIGEKLVERQSDYCIISA